MYVVAPHSDLAEGQVAALVQVQLDALVVVEQPATETQPAAPAEQYAEANAFAAKSLDHVDEPQVRLRVDEPLKVPSTSRNGIAGRCAKNRRPAVSDQTAPGSIVHCSLAVPKRPPISTPTEAPSTVPFSSAATKLAALAHCWMRKRPWSTNTRRVSEKP